MKLDGFRFRHLGPFGGDGVNVSGLRLGLNVIAEHNERGKSSLLAALETTLFTPHTSWTKAEKTLQREDGTPIGEVDFTHDGQSYRLHKRFVKSRYAELIDRQTGEVLATKREAEEKVGEMLGFNPGSHGPSGLLWVRQGDSMDRAEDDGQVASRLESELSTLVGGDRARAYLDRTETELGELLTRTGRVKVGGPLALAEDALATTEAALETATKARNATRQMGEDLVRLRDRIRATLAQGDVEKDAKDLQETKAALDRARIARSDLDRRRETITRLRLESDAATAKLTHHLQAVSTLEATKKEIAVLIQSRKVIATRQADAQARLSDLSTRLSELEESRTALSRMDRIRATQERLADRNSALAANSANLEALGEQIVRRREQIAARDALPAIGREDLDRLDKLERTLSRFATDLARVEASLTLDLLPDASASVDGVSVTSGPLHLNASQILRLTGVGTLRLDAPEADAVRARQAEAETELQDLQERLNVTSSEEALPLLRDRQDISDQIALTDQLIAQIAPDGRDALVDARDRLQTEVHHLAALLEDTPDLETVQNAATLEAEFATVRGEQSAARVSANEAGLELAKIDTTLQSLERQVTSAPETAHHDKRDAAHAALSGAAATLQARIETARADLDDAERQAPGDPDILDARIRRLSEVSANRAKALTELRMQEAELAARRRENFEQRDPEAEVTRLETRAERLAEDVSRHRRRASALVLLRDTLRESQRTLQDRYTAPVRRELLPLLQQVIDGADVALDETLGAQGLLRSGSDDALERLSGGTREQIAVLTRLAFARLLARGGQPCPVILDDALVYADDARRGRMFDVLNYVTSGEDPLQLIYLSCHEANALQLGGYRLRLDVWPED